MSDEITLNVLNNEVYLDETCWNCTREGKPEEGSPSAKDGMCELCDNTGFILTDTGKAILNLLKRHGGQNG